MKKESPKTKSSGTRTKAPVTHGRKPASKAKAVQNKDVQQVLQTLSDVVTRRTLAGILDNSTQTRNMDRLCGWPTEILPVDYRKMYDRQDFAKRIVVAFPDECWRGHPEVIENEEADVTVFEQAWLDLIRDDDVKIWHHLHRIDRLSGIGRYGVLFLGFDDGADFKKEVPMRPGGSEGTTRKLLYMRPFDETTVLVKDLESNTNNPRFGLPTTYQLTLPDGTGTTRSQVVHWSRVLHVAEDTEGDPVYGTPRLKCVYNRLLDVQKVLGGGAEMFWKGGFPGLAFTAQPDVEIDSADEARMVEQIDNYMNSLTRYLTLQGVDANVLSGQAISPKEHLEAQFKTISAATGIPLRVLFGSEQAQLASTQDRNNWMDRVQTRRENYLLPMAVRPFVQRLIDVGVLPRPANEGGFDAKWEREDALTAQEAANVQKTRSEALAAYAKEPVAQLIFPPAYFLREVLGMNVKVVEELMVLIGEGQAEEEEAGEGEEGAEE